MRTKHGACKPKGWTAEYRAWIAMRNRCNPSHKHEGNKTRYVNRGIKVCDQWQESFETFLADVGYRPSSQHSIDRVDNSRNYEPGNVRWATRSEQIQNRRCMPRFLYRGQYLTLIEVIKASGSTIAPYVLRYRIKHGWPLIIALETPLIQRSQRNSCKLGGMENAR